MTAKYDVIVVGARCSGAPTAMLLARKGYRVLLVDRSTFPSDTVSTHMVQAPGVALLEQWGLLGPVVAAGTPPIEKYTFDFGFDSGPVRLSGTARTATGHATAYAPRRTLLDKILVDGAAAAGAEVREHFTVEAPVFEDGRVVGVVGHTARGASVVERARVVVGADGRDSRIARAVGAQPYNEHPKGQYQYYTYWRDLPVDGFEVVIRPGRVWAAQPTNDGLTMLVVAWPMAQRNEFRADIERNYLRTLELSPEFAARVRGATRVEPFVGAAVANYFRKPYGPGWALVGDAAYNKDPITALGITDAFQGAELLSTAIDRTFTATASFDEAMADYQRIRDARNEAVYEHTAHLSRLEPASADFERLVRAMQGNQEAMDAFAAINAGIVSPVEFFDDANINRILCGVPAGAHR